MSTNSPTTKGLIAAGIGLGVLAGFVIGQFFVGGDNAQDRTPPAEPPSVTATASPDDSEPGFSDPTPSPSTPIPQAAQDRATEGIETYTQYSYRDRSFDSWKHRLSKISTDGYMESIEETFGTDDDARLEWETFIVPDKRETRTTVVNVTLDESGTFDNNNGDFLTFDVEYETAVRSAETNGWTTPTDTMRQWVTVAKAPDGTWLVNDIRTNQNRT